MMFLIKQFIITKIIVSIVIALDTSIVVQLLYDLCEVVAT